MARQPHVVSGPYTPPPARRTLTALSAGGARLHVEEHGPEDGPTVVLAHGWTCSTAFWAPVVRRLTADGHRVVAYDQRGHGRSPAADLAGYAPGALADDLCAVLEAAVPPGRRAVVAGHSMGGMTVMAAAGRPQLHERAAAVLLCNTGSSRLLHEARVVPLRSARLRRRLQHALFGSSLPLGPVTPAARRILKYGTMGRGAAPDQVEACARIVHACPRRVRAAWARVLAELDLDAELARLDIPTAVLAGGEDRLTPPAHARRIAEALPRCTGLTELPGAGHMAPVEAPDAVAGAVGTLVRSYLEDGRTPALPRQAAPEERPQERGAASAAGEEAR